MAVYINFLYRAADVNGEPLTAFTTANVLHTLATAMSLLRRCRVNAALTIQLFSHVSDAVDSVELCDGNTQRVTDIRADKNSQTGSKTQR